MNSRPRPLAKSLSILLITLVIGALLGAALTGALVRKRLDSLTALGSPGAFVAELLTVLEPTSDEQRAAITPILRRTGTEIETLLEETRGRFNATMERMSLELAQHLSPEQKQKLRERRNRMRERYSRFRDREREQPSAEQASR